MPHATPARRATDPTRAATAGLPPIYRAHTLAMEERFQAFAAREAVRPEVHQGGSAQIGDWTIEDEADRTGRHTARARGRR